MKTAIDKKSTGDKTKNNSLCVLFCVCFFRFSISSDMNQTFTFQFPSASITKITREDPQGTEERNLWREREMKSEISGDPAQGGRVRRIWWREVRRTGEGVRARGPVEGASD